MTRLTEYHNGVAVIKGKRYKEAAEKLAYIEDLTEKWETIAKKDACSYIHFDFLVEMLKGGAE